MVKKKQKDKSKLLGLNFYSSIIITLILHYFIVQNFNWSSTGQVAFDFLIFNIIFGVANIIAKIDFKKV